MVAKLSFRMDGGVSLSRETFDAALVREAIHAGAMFLPGDRGGTGSGDRRKHATCGCLSNRNAQVHVECRVLLAADGLGGQFSSTCR